MGRAFELIVFVFILLTPYVLIILQSPHIPYSKFHKQDESAVLKLTSLWAESSKKALFEIRKFMLRLDLKGPFFNRVNAQKVCVGVLSVQRNNVHYLKQNIAALLSRSRLSDEHQFQITVFNANCPPSLNLDVESLNDLIFVKNMYLESEEAKSCDIELPRKEFLDYINVLEDLQKKNCEYYLVLEDDALPCLSWTTKVHETLKMIDEMQMNWIVVRFFAPLIWTDWFNKRSFILDDNLIFMSCVIIFTWIQWVVFRFVMLTIRWKYNPTDSNANQHRSHYHFAFVVSSIIMMFCLGRHSIVRYPPGVHVHPVGASAVANAYSHKGLQHLIEYFRKYLKSSLKNKKIIPKDLHFEDMVSSLGDSGEGTYLELISIPNCFQHMGAVSSIRSSSEHSLILTREFENNHEPIKFSEEAFLS